MFCIKMHRVNNFALYIFGSFMLMHAHNIKNIYRGRARAHKWQHHFMHMIRHIGGAAYTRRYVLSWQVFFFLFILCVRLWRLSPDFIIKHKVRIEIKFYFIFALGLLSL